MSSSKYAGATLITALYSDVNELISVNCVPVETTSAGVNVAAAYATGDVPAGGYAKVFIWDMSDNKLTPIN